MAAYERWKRDPHRVQVAARDWRGRYIPDLKIKRVERTLWLGLAVIIALGAAVGWTVMTTPLPHLTAP